MLILRAAKTAFCAHAHIKQIQKLLVFSTTQSEAYFFVQNGEKETYKGDYNLIRARKSWLNPPERTEMPLCYRLLRCSLNAPLWAPMALKLHCHSVILHI